MNFVSDKDPHFGGGEYHLALIKYNTMVKFIKIVSVFTIELTFQN